MRRSVLAVLVCFVAAGATAAEIDLVNGDRLTGTLAGAADGYIVLENGYAGAWDSQLHLAMRYLF